jgi:L-fuculose-phosphate aldolase
MEDGNIACTPSSLDYRIMTVDDICIVNPAGEQVVGERGPTSEKYLHLAVMNAYEDIAVCIHSHAVHATMFAVAHQDIPSCIDEFTVYLGGDIRCSEYAPSGSPDLAEQVVKALENRGAALIANHGMVAIGTTMEKTMHNTALVERSAEIIWGAKQLGGIFPLPEKVNANFASVYPYMR